VRRAFALAALLGLTACATTKTPVRPANFPYTAGPGIEAALIAPAKISLHGTMYVQVSPEVVEHHVKTMADSFGAKLKAELPAEMATAGYALSIRNKNAAGNAAGANTLLVISPRRAEFTCQRLYFQNTCKIGLVVHLKMLDAPRRKTVWEHDYVLTGDSSGDYDIDIAAFWNNLYQAMQKAGLAKAGA